LEGKVKETEAVTVKNAEEEDKFENKIAKLQGRSDNISSRAPPVVKM